MLWSSVNNFNFSDSDCSDSECHAMLQQVVMQLQATVCGLDGSIMANASYCGVFIVIVIEYQMACTPSTWCWSHRTQAEKVQHSMLLGQRLSKAHRMKSVLASPVAAV